MKRYHGWIYREKTEGMKDFFSVQWGSPSQTKTMGYGEVGANNSVEHFETTLKLGHVRLEETPLGLRVFTEEEVPA